MFKGYWNQPEKTRESFNRGWFKSGDLGYQDPEDDLRLYLVGRAKELIITGGYNVYPKEIENILENHAAVKEAAVFGLAHEDFGEQVAAAVVLEKEAPGGLGIDPILQDPSGWLQVSSKNIFPLCPSSKLHGQASKTGTAKGI